MYKTDPPLFDLFWKRPPWFQDPSSNYAMGRGRTEGVAKKIYKSQILKSGFRGYFRQIKYNTKKQGRDISFFKIKF